MKSLKPVLTANAAVILLIAVGLFVVLTNNGTRQNSAASNAALSQARMPVLKINGPEDGDVYLQSLDIQVEVIGNIASTRHTMVFRNRTNRVLEGTLTFPLPDGRSVTHYALDINGRLRESVPVEKARGTEVFEEIEQRRVDPGLLERVEGNNFRTRIYPFPAGETRTVSIGYEEELTLENEKLLYRMPMVYPDSLEEFSVKATVWKSGQKPIVPKSEKKLRFVEAGESYVASFVRQNYRPAGALVFTLPAPAGVPPVITRSAGGNRYFLASVAPDLEPRKKRWDNELAIIWDVSLSASQRDLRREIEILDIIFAEKKNADVHLYFLNNKFKKIADKNAANGEYKVVNGKWGGLKKILKSAVFDGGTDFSEIDINNIAGNEILFFSDGISTLSDADFLKDAKIERPIHCVVSSARADYGAMRLIADKTNGKFVNVNELSSQKLKNEMLNETPLFLGTEHGTAVREIYPSVATPVYGNFSVAGIADKDSAELSLLFGFGDSVEKRINVRIDAKIAEEKRGDVCKIWAQKKIAELDLDYEKNRAELAALGKRFGIVTRNTSLIVLETVEDYIRYGIAPPAELRDEYRRKKERGGFGFSGGIDDLLETSIDSSGNGNSTAFGAASDQIKGERVASANFFCESGFATDIDAILSYSKLKPTSPDFLQGAALTGRRSPAKIWGVIIQDKAALRYAYKRRLREKPGLSGEITVKFAIDEFGKVVFALMTKSTMADSVFEKTVMERVKNLTFGKIDSPGDVTEAFYPFIFVTGVDDRQAKNENSQTRYDAAVRKEAAAKERDRQSRSVAMLNDAVVAAFYLKRWLDMDFTPQKPTYSAPEEEADRNDDSAKGGPARIIAQSDARLEKLTGKTADDYQIYLKVRNDYAGSPTFYFDMANWFYARGDKETALRVLTSIADLELENAALYRLLGYRFKEYGEYGLAKFVCGKVVRWRPMEPQSYRDYALALADVGETQAALDSLYSLLKKPYSNNIRNRNRGMEEVVVTEINHLIVRNPNLNTSKIDKRLIANIPVDIRVVINWNMDNANVNLYVEGPKNENCHYRHGASNICGRISADITSGYGPEQFILKNATAGKYQVYVKYYGDRRFTEADGPPTVMAEIYTKYADKTEQRRIISTRISNAKKIDNNEKVLVAEFDF